MTPKSVTNLAMFLTVLLLLGFGILLVFGQLVAMNGFNSRQASAAFVITFLCQGGGVVAATFLAARLARRLFEQSKWSQFTAVAVSVFAGVSVGVALSAIGAVAALLVGESL
jgi:hypothetical protein